MASVMCSLCTTSHALEACPTVLAAYAAAWRGGVTPSMYRALERGLNAALGLLPVAPAPARPIPTPHDIERGIHAWDTAKRCDDHMSVFNTKYAKRYADTCHACRENILIAAASLALRDAEEAT